MTEQAAQINKSNTPATWEALIEIAVFLAFLLAVYYYVPSFFTFRDVLIPLRVPLLFLFGWASLRRRNMNWGDLGFLRPPTGGKPYCSVQGLALACKYWSFSWWVPSSDRLQEAGRICMCLPTWRMETSSLSSAGWQYPGHSPPLARNWSIAVTC